MTETNAPKAGTNTPKAALGNMKTYLWLERNKNPEPIWMSVSKSDLEVVMEHVKNLEHSLELTSNHLSQAIQERDETQEWADKLAAVIAPVEVLGEHTSNNNPWANALGHLDTKKDAQS